MPGYFFFFGGYEVTRELLAKPNESRDDIGWQKTMIAGAVGGSILWLVIFPADVVKSRIQVSLILHNLNNLNYKYKLILIFFKGKKFENFSTNSYERYCKK